MIRKLAAEGVGTAMLLATVVGSGIMAEQLADGNMAIALLANAVATGAILTVLILIFGPVSGAHFNPAVSLAFALRREIDGPTLAAYVAVQAAGACLGVFLAHAMFDLPIFQISQTTRTGTGQWIGEIVATFGLVATILGTLHHRADAVPYAVGLYITAGYWFTSSTSFANPAVTLARGLSDTFAGIRPIDGPWFMAMQILGAVIAVWFFRWILASAQHDRAG